MAPGAVHRAARTHCSWGRRLAPAAQDFAESLGLFLQLTQMPGQGIEMVVQHAGYALQRERGRTGGGAHTVDLRLQSQQLFANMGVRVDELGYRPLPGTEEALGISSGEVAPSVKIEREGMIFHAPLAVAAGFVDGTPIGA